MGGVRVAGPGEREGGRGADVGGAGRGWEGVEAETVLGEGWEGGGLKCWFWTNGGGEKVGLYDFCDS